MSHSCVLIEQSFFHEKMEGLIKSLIAKKLNNKSVEEIKKYYIAEILKLKEEFNSPKDFDSAVKNYLEDTIDLFAVLYDADFLDEFLEIDYNDDFTNTESLTEEEGKLDPLSSSREKIERYTIKSLFLRKYFKGLNFSKNAFLQNFKKEVISRTFKDRNGNYIDFNNPKNFTKNMKDYRNDLINKIKEGLSLEKQRVFLDYIDNSDFNGAINYIKSSFDISEDSISNILIIDTLPKAERTKLEAWLAFVAFSEFDNLLEYIFEKAISIKRPKYYDYISLDKYNLRTGDKNARSWHDQDEDVDESGQLNSLTLLFLETLPLYRNGSKLSLRTMDSKYIKSTIGSIMQIFNNTSTLDNIIITPEETKKIETEFESIYGENAIKEIILNYISLRSLSDIISEAKLNPTKLMPIVFYILSDKKLKVFQNQLNYIDSIYMNIYAPTNSVLSGHVGEYGLDPETNSIYNYINGLFINIEYTEPVEYIEDEEGLHLVQSYVRNLDDRYRQYSYLLYNKYDKKNDITTSSNDLYTIGDNTQIPNRLLKNVNIKISNDYEIITYSTGVVTLLKNGKKVNNISKSDFETISNAIYDILEINKDVVNQYIINGTYENLVNAAGHIIYNYVVGRHMIGVEASDYNKTVEDYYFIGATYYKKIPDKSTKSILPRIINTSDTQTLKDLSAAKDIVEGYSSINTVKDASNKQLSSIGLSKLASKVKEFWSTHLNGAASDLSFYSLFEGFELMRDYGGFGEVKSAKEFTPAEFAAASILVDMYGDMYEWDDNNFSIKLGGMLRVPGPIISDKSNLMKLRFKWDSQIGDYEHTDGTPLTLRNASINDLKTVIFNDYHTYYKKLYDGVILNWATLNEYLPDQFKNIGVKFDYNSNFRQFNEYCKKIGVNPFDILRETMLNAKHLGVEIYLTDQIDYISKNGIIQNNPALLHLCIIYEVINPTTTYVTSFLPDIVESYEEFWERKETRLVTDFLQQNIVLQLESAPTVLRKGDCFKTAKYRNQVAFDTSGNQYKQITIDSSVEDKTQRTNIIANHSSYKYFKDNYYDNEFPDIYDVNSENFNEEETIKAVNEYINKSGFINMLGCIVPVKFVRKGRSSKIADKYDFKSYSLYRRLMKDPTLDSIYDIDSPDFNLQLTFRKINEELPKWEALDDVETIRESIKSENSSKFTDNNESFRRLNIYYNNTLSTLNYDLLLFTANQIYQNNIARLNESREEDNKLEYSEENWNNKVLRDFLNKEDLINYILDNNIRQNITDNLTSDQLESLGYGVDKLHYEINPEIIRHNLFDYYLAESYALSTKGSFVALPAKGKNIREYEALQFGLFIKRGVPYTASKHREMQNLLNGIPTLRLAIIDDIKDSILTFSGTYDPNGITVHDGSVYYNPVLSILSNNSLGGDAMGVDKKPFGFFTNSFNGIGITFKCAGFTLTNNRVRQFDFDKLQLKKMLDLNWESLGITDVNWKLDYNDKEIDYGVWYLQRNGEWFGRFVDENGIVKEQSSFDDGTLHGVPQDVPENISSNWDLYTLFGGEYSASVDSSTGKLKLDESSINLLTKACNLVGRKFSGKVFNQSDIDQQLKRAMTHIIAGKGAIKDGAINVNPKETWFNDEELLTFEVDTFDIGELLDAEHSAQEGDVAMMTQIMNTAGARGYTYRLAQDIYEALRVISRHSNVVGLDSVEEMLNSDSGNEASENFSKFVSNMLFKALTKASDQDGDLFNAIASKSIQNANSDISSLSRTVPIDHPAIFGKIMSSISSQLERSIRLRFEGNQFVLNPSHKRFQLVGDRPIGYYRNKQDELLVLEEQYKNTKQVNSHADLSVGHYYKSESGEIKYIDSAQDIYDFDITLNWHETVIDQNGEALGRDLATYECRFVANGVRYSTWMLDSVRQLHQYDELKDGFLIPDDGASFLTELLNNWNKLDNDLKLYNITKHPEYLDLLTVSQLDEVNTLEDYPQEWNDGVEIALRLQLQKEFNALSSGIETTVKINGQYLTVDKNSVEISPYECAFPKVSAEEFGLKEGDNVSDIVNNKNFFLERAVQNWNRKVYMSELYDVELKTSNGNHIYLGLNTPSESSLENLTVVNLELGVNVIFDGDKLYRINEKGKKMYSLPYSVDDNGNITKINATIYLLSNGLEIIYSSNLTYFLDLFKYNQIIFSENDNDNKIELFKQLSLSQNKTAIRKYNYIINSINNNYKKGSSVLSNSLKSWLRDTSEDDNSLSEFLSSLDEILDPDQTLSATDILSNEQGREMLNWIIKNDSRIADKKLEKLKLDIAKGSVSIKDHQFFSGLIHSSMDMHTSFVEYLERIVTRTPGQSLQSCMTMKIACFAPEDTNVIYVSKEQIFFLGSDYDIDKISTFSESYRNGKLIPWSLYFNLQSKLTLEASKKLPFPTGRKLAAIGEKTPYDVLPNNISVNRLNNLVYLTTQSGLQLIVDKDNNTISALGWDEMSKLDKYYIIRRAFQEVSEYPTLVNFEISKDAVSVLRKESNYLYLDFKEFNDSIIELDNKNPKFILENIIELAPNLNTLISVYNKLGYIPDGFDDIKKIVDDHNMYFENRSYDIVDAARNFIAIRIKQVAKDIANLILAQSGIDVEVLNLSRIATNIGTLQNATKYTDRGSVYSKFFMSSLTLGGKDSVGIEASQLKNFEAISLHSYLVLNEGTAQLQKALLANLKFMGKIYKLVANAQSNNDDTIKDADVRNAVKEVDLVIDTYLVYSAFVTASTDNAKNPILPMLNAYKSTIALYNAGVLIGAPVKDIAKLMLSKTGLLLKDLTSGNVFSGQKAKSIELALNYLTTPPDVKFSYYQLKAIGRLLLRLGIITNLNDFNLKQLSELLKNPKLSSEFIGIFKFLRNPQKSSYYFNPNNKELDKIDSVEIDPERVKRNRLRVIDDALYNLNRKNESLRSQDDRKKIALLESERNSIENDITDYVNTANSDNDNLNLENLKLDKRKCTELYKWCINYRTITQDVVYNDDGTIMTQLVTDSEGNPVLDDDGNQKVSKIRPYRELRRLARISKEQSALRPGLALNQGLPNTVQEQFLTVENLSNIISDRLKDLGIDTATGMMKEPELLDELEESNKGTENKYRVDLNRFVNDPVYKDKIKRIYDDIKVFTNPYRIIDEVAHYLGYLSLLNLLYQIGLTHSNIYRAFDLITREILPQLRVTKKYRNAVEKNITSIIFNEINTKFLQAEAASGQAVYNIPLYKFENYTFTLYPKENGKYKTMQIKLGNRSDNEAFALWFLHVKFPELKRKYPDNEFIKSLGFTRYDYTLDKNAKIVLGKTKRFNMENPAELVLFNLAKRDLFKLTPEEIKMFYYYNIITFNNQAGLLSMSNLFEDVIQQENDGVTSRYNKFIAESDDLFKDIVGDSVRINQILKDIAPVVSKYDKNENLNIKYIRCENNVGDMILYQKTTSNDGNYDDEDSDGYVPVNSYTELSENENSNLFDEYVNFSFENRSKNRHSKDFKISIKRGSNLDKIKIRIGTKEYTTDRITKEINKTKPENKKMKRSDIFLKEHGDYNYLAAANIINDSLNPCE